MQNGQPRSIIGEFADELYSPLNMVGDSAGGWVIKVRKVYFRSYATLWLLLSSQYVLFISAVLSRLVLAHRDLLSIAAGNWYVLYAFYVHREMQGASLSLLLCIKVSLWMFVLKNLRSLHMLICLMILSWKCIILVVCPFLILLSQFSLVF